MQTPTIVKQTKEYILVKIPLPKQGDDVTLPTPKNNKMTAAEKRLWGILRTGEKEYREGKTIRARSIDEALKIYEKKEDRVR